MPQPFSHQMERKVGILKSIKCSCASPPKQNVEAWIICYGCTQRQWIYEIPHQRCKFRSASTNSRTTDNDFILSHVSGHENMKSSQQSGEQRGSLMCAKPYKPGCEIFPDAQWHLVAVKGLNFWTPPVCRQIRNWEFSSKLAAPILP